MGFSPISTPLPGVHIPLQKGSGYINVYLCTAGFRTSVPRSAPSHPHIASEGLRYHTKMCWLSHVKQWLYREKISGFILCYFNLQGLLFSPREIWRMMYCPLTFRVRRFVIYWLRQTLNLKACWPVAVQLFTPQTCFKLFSPPGMKQRLFFFFIQTKCGQGTKPLNSWKSENYLNSLEQ